MSSEAIDLCLDELDTAHRQLTDRLTALQLYAQQGITDESRAWLQGEMSAARDQLSLMEVTRGWLTTLQATDYPQDRHAPLPDAVKVDLDTVLKRMVASTSELTDILAPVVQGTTAPLLLGAPVERDDEAEEDEALPHV